MGPAGGLQGLAGEGAGAPGAGRCPPGEGAVPGGAARVPAVVPVHGGKGAGGRLVVGSGGQARRVRLLGYSSQSLTKKRYMKIEEEKHKTYINLYKFIIFLILI